MCSEYRDVLSDRLCDVCLYTCVLSNWLYCAHLHMRHQIGCVLFLNMPVVRQVVHFVSVYVLSEGLCAVCLYICVCMCIGRLCCVCVCVCVHACTRMRCQIGCVAVYVCCQTGCVQSVSVYVFFSDR